MALMKGSLHVAAFVLFSISTASCNHSTHLSSDATNDPDHSETSDSIGCDEYICDEEAVGYVCGNNIAEADESCDGDDLALQTCSTLGYDGGELLCDDDCRINESGCNYFPECVRYADVESEAPEPDGLTWGSAFNEVQQAVDSAFEATEELGSCEVWVKEGTYFIYKSAETDLIQLMQNVSLYGGFQGTEIFKEQRDWVIHETILDGADGEDGASFVHRILNGASRAILDGFIVQRGTGNGDGPENAAGGMLNDACSPTIRNCIFRNNYGGNYGGGITNINGASPLIEHSTFIDNLAVGGGGIYNVGSSPEISGCLFNTEESHSCDIYNIEESDTTVINSAFRGIYWIINANGSEIVVKNSTFAGETGLMDEFGLMTSTDAQSWFINCTVSVVSTARPSGLVLGDNADVHLFNSILWGARIASISTPYTLDVQFSNIEDEYPGWGNISEDPMFYDPLDDLRLLPGSPCIDAGTAFWGPEFDIVGNPRFDDPETEDTGYGSITYADIGAYEYLP